MVESDFPLAVKLILNAKMPLLSPSRKFSTELACPYAPKLVLLNSSYIYHEKNFIADDLAHLGLSCSLGPFF